MSYRVESGKQTFIRAPQKEENILAYRPETILLVYRKPPEVYVQNVRMKHVATGAVSFTRRADGIHIDFNPKTITVDGRVHDRRYKTRTVIVQKGERVSLAAVNDRAFLYYPDGGRGGEKKLRNMTVVNKRRYRQPF